MNLDLVKGLARGLTADVAGAPVDLMSQIANLGLAAGGYVGHKTGLLKQPWDLIEQPIGGSDWFAKNTILQDPGTAAYTAGRFTGNVAPLFPKIARSIPLQRDSSPNALVWHGSPHKFDKFDSSKIGTGEGAQAYGHGLYLAESPDVARGYRDKLTPGAGWGYDNVPANSLDKTTRAAATQLSMEMRGVGTQNGWPDVATAKQMAARKLLKQGDKAAATMVAKLDPAKIAEIEGSLYKVDLPDEQIAKMLDWDKPLSQQAPSVQAALANTQNKQLRAVVDYSSSPYSTPGLEGEVKTIGEAIKLLGMNTSPAKGSAMLAKQGIPGVRYLDGGSRGAGQGTSNYVVFPGEEHALRILERNGLPLETGLGSKK